MQTVNLFDVIKDINKIVAIARSCDTFDRITIVNKLSKALYTLQKMPPAASVTIIVNNSLDGRKDTY